VQGAGVADAEVISEQLEERLRADAPGGPGRIEVLNFGVGAYTPLEILYALDHKALDFDPDAIFYVAHSIDVEQVVVRLAADARAGVGIPYPRLAEVLARVGVEKGMAQSLAERLLRPFGVELTQWIYQRIVEQARARGIPAVWIYLPRINERVQEDEVDELFALAERSGFAVIDLRGLYDERDLDELRLAEWDNHPNAAGNALIVEWIHREILARPQEILFPAGAAGGPTREPGARAPAEAE
jgi:hypothetical protein